MKKSLRYSLPEWIERVDENTSTVMDKTRAPRLIQSQDDQRVLKNKTYLFIDTTSGIIEKCVGAIVAPTLKETSKSSKSSIVCIVAHTSYREQRYIQNGKFKTSRYSLTVSSLIVSCNLL